MVFKLERERPAYAVHQDALYYVKVRTYLVCVCAFVCYVCVLGV